ARICLDDTLGCDDENGYTVKEPVLTMTRLFDTFRYLIDDIVVSRIVTDFSQQLAKNDVDVATQRLAASEAVLLLSNATLGRSGQSGATEGIGASIFGHAADPNPDPSVKEFQLNYMNCKVPDILSPLKE